ncbi:MAG: CvpA family protein [Patescibacteria group bacterium]
MGAFTVVLLLIFFGFIAAGFYFGIIHTIGAVIGAVAGVWIASHFYPEITPFIQFFMIKGAVADAISFIVILLVVSRLIGFVVHMLDQGFKIIKIIPFASSINRLGGAMFGFVEAALVIGTILYVTSQFNISPQITDAINNTPFAGLLMNIAKILLPLIPVALKTNPMDVLPI